MQRMTKRFRCRRGKTHDHCFYELHQVVTTAPHNFFLEKQKMKQKTEQIEDYKKMVLQSPNKMEDCIKQHLEKNCFKFIGNEDKFDRCIEYLTECAREILDGKNGDVPDDVCYKICSDYFDDEIWKIEDEEKATKKAEIEARKNEKPIVAPEIPKRRVEKQLDFLAAMGV